MGAYVALSGGVIEHVEAISQVGSDTFQHVHIHEGNVYDFTDWVSAHPGRQACNV